MSTHAHTHTHTHRVSEATQKVSKKAIPPHVQDLVLEMCCDDANGEDAEVPFIQYRFR